MRGEQAIFNLEIKKKSGLSINPDIHHSKVFSSGVTKKAGTMREGLFITKFEFFPPLPLLGNTFKLLFKSSFSSRINP